MFGKYLNYPIAPNYTYPKSFKEFLPSFRIPNIIFKRTWEVLHIESFAYANEFIVKFRVCRNDGASCWVFFHIRQDATTYWTINDKETKYSNNLMRRVMKAIDSELTNNSNQIKANQFISLM